MVIGKLRKVASRDQIRSQKSSNVMRGGNGSAACASK